VVIAGVLGAASAGLASAERVPVESSITAVTVFPDQAAITRRAQVRLAKGAQTMEIGPLPSGIDPQSISAKGRGEMAVTLYGVQLVTRQLAQAQDARVTTLEEALRDLEDRRQSLNNLRAILAQERDYLRSIQAASGEQIGKDLVTRAPSATDAAALLQFLDTAFLSLAEREQKSQRELEQIAREEDRLRRELAELTQGRQRAQTLMLVEMDAQKSGDFDLEVSYRVYGAGWAPSYEARAAAASAEVVLGSSALVRQQTGEDWADVQLTLSTARPAMAGSMPELEPWFLRPWEPPVIDLGRLNKARREMSAMGGAMLSDEEEQVAYSPTSMLAAAPPAEAVAAEAVVEAQGPAVTYRLSKTVSIPADAQPHKVPITSSTLATVLAYEATPRLAPYAFLRAKATNATEQFYLPGPVSVFLDGAFVATAALKPVAPGEVFDLYLGVDERLRLERRTLKERVEISLLPGLRGKTKSTDYEFLTTLENFTGRKVAVTVFDQLPVSDREEIIVESVKQTPGDVTKDPEKPGVFSWALELGPSQKQELRLSYRVRHPVDMRVQ
jgi:uncharacterized protein (TIGR02231 family)